MDEWLASHGRPIPLILVAVAVAVREPSFLESMRLRCAVGANGAIRHYYDAGTADRRGRIWLWSRLPMHSWHRSVAAQYLSAHTDDRERLSQEAATAGGDVTPEELLWNRWMGMPAFYQDPLYAYLIALTYRVAGPDPRHVIVWQLAVGMLVGVILIWRLALRWLGHAVGLVAAALTLLNGPLVFYELLLLRDSLIVFAGLGSVWLINRAFRRGSAMGFVGLGAAMGASILLKGTFILLAAGVLIAMLVRFRRQPSALVRTSIALLAGLVIALAPLAARNLAVGVPPLSLASSGALTFVASNERNYLPDVGLGSTRRSLPASGSDGQWRPAVAATLEGHSVRSYLAMMWMKWDRAWHWYEMPNNENFYYMRTQVPVLAWLPATFWVCAARARRPGARCAPDEIPGRSTCWWPHRCCR